MINRYLYLKLKECIFSSTRCFHILMKFEIWEFLVAGSLSQKVFDNITSHGATNSGGFCGSCFLRLKKQHVAIQAPDSENFFHDLDEFFLPNKRGGHLSKGQVIPPLASL